MIQGLGVESILPRSTSKIPVSQKLEHIDVLHKVVFNHRSFCWEPGEDIHHRANSNACSDGLGPGALAFSRWRAWKSQMKLVVIHFVQFFWMKQMGRQEQAILTVCRHANIIPMNSNANHDGIYAAKKIGFGAPQDTWRQGLESMEMRRWQGWTLEFCHTFGGAEVIHKRWSGVMNKFAVWNTDLSTFKQLPHVPCGEVWRMTEYSQVALLDTDMVFDVDSESLLLNWFWHFFCRTTSGKKQVCLSSFSLCFAIRVPNCPFCRPREDILGVQRTVVRSSYHPQCKKTIEEHRFILDFC